MRRPNLLAFSARLAQDTEKKKEGGEEEEEEEGGGGGEVREMPFDGKGAGGGGYGDGDDGDKSDGSMDGISSAFIFACWAAFVGYCSFYSPNQTPVCTYTA
jgi:hypothetical protein